MIVHFKSPHSDGDEIKYNFKTHTFRRSGLHTKCMDYNSFIYMLRSWEEIVSVKLKRKK